MKMLVKIAAVLAFCFILVEGRAHSPSLLQQMKLLRESRTYGGHPSMFSGSSMFKRLPLADGEDESETETEEQDSEVETEENNDTEEDASQGNDIEDIARKLEKALLKRKFYRVFNNDRRDTPSTTPETETSESESEAVERGLVMLAKKIDKMLGQRDTSDDDEETEADNQESSAGEADDTEASDEESSDGEEEEEEIERELLKELLARRLF